MIFIPKFTTLYTPKYEILGGGHPAMLCVDTNIYLGIIKFLSTSMRKYHIFKGKTSKQKAGVGQ